MALRRALAASAVFSSLNGHTRTAAGAASTSRRGTSTPRPAPECPKPCEGERAITLPPVDFGRAAADYARFRQGFPPAFFARLDAMGVGRPGQRAVDLGTGTGLLARDLARRGCLVTGVDLSAPLLAQARALDREAGLEIAYEERPAEATGLPGAAFDLVTAATAWHWFDRERAAGEALRLLAPGGRLLIADQGWWRVAGGIVDLTLTIIDRFSPVAPNAPTAGGWYDHPRWTHELADAGFLAYEAFGFTIPLAYSHAAWRGRIRASARVGPVMDEATLEAFDRALATALREAYPHDNLAVEHQLFALLATS